MHKSLTPQEISAARDAAMALYRNVQPAAMAALAPIVQDIAATVAAIKSSPFDNIDWHDLDFAPAFEAWREAIGHWKASNYQGLTPGQSALCAILDRVTDDVDQLEHDDLDVEYRGESVPRFIRQLARQVFGDGSGMDTVMLDAIVERVRSIWYDEALRSGVPSGIHAEFCFVPNWDGEDIDSMIDRLALRGTRWRACNMAEIEPTESLKLFLQWVNVSSSELREAVREYRENDFAAFKLNMKGLSVRKDSNRSSLLTAKQVIDVIENAGASLPVPMAHCEVEVRALFAHDMRRPMALPLQRGGTHLGMHDVVNGSGYIDCWSKGPVVVPPMHTGFGWVGRWRYGIDAVYGIVKRPFYCTPAAAESITAEAG